MSVRITKAVFPVAGMGTRFLPATKANPKEMLPIVDKPLIQYAVEEAIEAGMTEMIFVTSSSKRAIEDHFDSNFELETKLAETGKHELAEIIRNILPKGTSCAYVRQPDALGLGHAVLCAKSIIGNEPFAVVLADDLIDGETKPCLSEMVAAYQETHRSIIAVEQVPSSETHCYGIVDIEHTDGPLGLMRNIIEKPAPGTVSSNLAVVGRYILTPEIFTHLACIEAGQGGEIQLTDAIAQLLEKQPVYTLQFSGKRYDCGSKLGYLKATIAYALKHPEIGAAFQQYLTSQHRHDVLKMDS